MGRTVSLRQSRKEDNFARKYDAQQAFFVSVMRSAIKAGYPLVERYQDCNKTYSYQYGAVRFLFASDYRIFRHCMVIVDADYRGKASVPYDKNALGTFVTEAKRLLDAFRPAEEKAA